MRVVNITGIVWVATYICIPVGKLMTHECCVDVGRYWMIIISKGDDVVLVFI